MSGFAQVFLLELRLRRAVFPAALVAGIIPIPMAWIMSRNFGFSEALNAGAFAFALIGGELLALYLGATVLCQDLSEAAWASTSPGPSRAWPCGRGSSPRRGSWCSGPCSCVSCPATFMGGGLANLKVSDNPFWTYDCRPAAPSRPSGRSSSSLALAALLFMAFAHAVSVMFRSQFPLAHSRRGHGGACYPPWRGGPSGA